jgi:hypothetical protein
MPSTLPSAAPSSCFEQLLDFNDFDGGDYIGDLSSTYGVVIHATASTAAGFTPGNKARVFDTSLPTRAAGNLKCTNNPNDGDPDLGSPNSLCPNGGPGIGRGGAPLSPYSNCVAIGNVIVIQEGNKQCPDDSAGGGKIRFTFTEPTIVDYIQMLDIDDHGITPIFRIHHAGGLNVTSFPPTGDNGFYNHTVNFNSVNWVEVEFNASGSVAGIGYHRCPRA